MIALLQTLIAIIFLIAGTILYEFIKTKNGQLRKIMIGYFSCELWKNLIGLILISKYGNEMDDMASLGIFLMVFPKAIVKIFLYRYLVKNK